MSGHTPGPWKLETVKTSSGFCHKIGPFPWKEGRDNHACIYVDYPNGAVGPVELELKANAQLMVAAPDLLEIAQRILDRGYVSGSIEEERDDYAALRAAITLATTDGREG